MVPVVVAEPSPQLIVAVKSLSGSLESEVNVATEPLNSLPVVALMAGTVAANVGAGDADRFGR